MSDELVGPVLVGPIAHGGHCVARHPSGGRVIFVRHALPGEQVLLRLTDIGTNRYWRADAVQILTSSPERVTPRCPVAGPGLCGGCDFQHVELGAQRRLKAQVVAEQLQRLAGIDWAGAVEEVSTPQTADGLGWRTRMRYHADDHGRPALRAHRSHDLVLLPASGCPLAAPSTPPVIGRPWPPDAEIVTAAGHEGEAVIVNGRLVAGESVVQERVEDRTWSVEADGFWQVHPAAASVLVDAVLAGLAPAAGERVFDLYCGVGLFSRVLTDAGCRVWGVEVDRTAVGHARRNVPGARFTVGRVDRALRSMPRSTDLVVLDPPRSGVGRAVMESVLARRPRAVAYVACDPAALARDLGTAAGLGYLPTSIRAFDLFPMTHHVECVAILLPSRTPEPKVPVRRGILAETRPGR